MAWEECVTSIRQNLGQTAKEPANVIWTGPNAEVTPQQLDGDSFLAGRPFPLICPDRHCQDELEVSIAAHAYCRCVDMNNNPIPNCIAANALQPVKGSICLNIDNTSQFGTQSGRACTRQGDSYYALTCYCCCSCYANGTKIAVPLGYKTIEYFQKGDEVLTGWTSSGKLKWHAGKVTFSMGTGDSGHQSAMVYMHYSDDNRQIVVTPDQLFLLPNGKLKRADRLVPGQDQLVNEFNKPVDIHEVSIGEYFGGVHHISTSTEFTGQIDGHLLLSEGVVSGDFSLQANSQQLIELGIMEDHSEQAKIGSEDYEQTNGLLAKEYHGVSHVTALADGSREKVQRPQQFYVHGERSRSIPETAAAYFDEAQTDDIYNNAPRWDFENIGINAPMVKYVLQLFRAFYPDINFYYDQSNIAPNAYTFQEMGVTNVVIAGGLTRIKGMGQEGISFVLAHMVSASQKMAPAGENGWTSVAMADYYSMMVLMNVYFGNNYAAIYKPGMQQIDDCMFKYISDANKNYMGDPFEPSVDTRFDAMEAGNAMNFPPPGIGGPVAGGLKVVAAKAFAPMVGLFSFISADINEDQSQEAYEALVNNDIITDNGEVAATFGMNTDLDFLFTSVTDENQRGMMIGEVRSKLLHAPGTIQVEFSETVNATVSYHDFTFDPDVKVWSAEAKANIPVVEVLAEIRRGVEYTLTVSSGVHSTNGSTLDKAQRTVTVKIP